MKIKGQIDFTDEIIVDSFAGGGGASTGIEEATGRIVSVAINHDPDAILMHKTNHPFTEHYQASVWELDPVELCAGRSVGLAWFSPDCKHFSKAKGAALCDRHIRGLAWIVLRWAGNVRPRVIMLENVEEFKTWGPVRKGKPVKKKAGTTFAKWLSQLTDLGYAVDYRELIAADYGAPTSRKRFCLIARCDGKPIVWPERTHAPADHPLVKAGKLLPWRSAAEIIDWSIPCYSVFESKDEIKEKYGATVVRPLAENTMRRIIRGVDKFTIRSGKPFLIPTGYGERDGQKPRVHDLDAPLPTVVSTVKQNLAEPVMAPFTFPNTANSVGSAADKPVYTVTSSGNQILACGNLFQYHTEQTENARINRLSDPLPTVDGSNRYGMTAAYLTEYYGNGNPIGADEPLHTVTAHDRDAIVAVHVDKYFAGGYHGGGNRADEPLSTITVEPRQSLVALHIAEFKGQDVGQSIEKPLRTTTAGGGQFSPVYTVISRYERVADVGYWPKIRQLLNRFCGYSLKDDEILLIFLSGIAYYIRDIKMRMLTPRELYSAMGFPSDYVIEHDYTGKEYPRSKQVARCGNAVCPPMAAAMVRANLPEWVPKITITTMKQLYDMVAASV